MLLLSSILSLAVCICIFIKKKWNSLASPFFLTNILCLFLYILPTVFLPWPVSAEAQDTLAICILGLNTGLIPFLNKKFEINHIKIGAAIHKKTIIICWASGMLIFLSMYLLKGIPILSNNIDQARENFLSGTGFFSWPATALIITSLLLLYLRLSFNKWAAITALSIAFLFLSGWRGYIVFAIFPVIIIMSLRSQIKPKHAALLIILAFSLSISGILRAEFSSGSIYGLTIKNTSNLSELLTAVFTYIVLRLGEHIIGLQHTIEHFRFSPLVGQGILMDMSYILPFYDESLAKLMRRYYANWESGGAMTITMAGAFYADFHNKGVFFMSAASSYAYSSLYYNLIRGTTGRETKIVLSGILSTAWCFSFMGTFFAQFTMYLLVYSVVTYLVHLLDSILIGATRNIKA